MPFLRARTGARAAWFGPDLLTHIWTLREVRSNESSKGIRQASGLGNPGRLDTGLCPTSGGALAGGDHGH